MSCNIDERSALLDINAPSVADHEELRIGESSSSASLRGESTSNVGKIRENSFPWRFAISVYVLTCITPLAFELVFPFVNQMILENGIASDPERVGFYSGLIESIFAFMSFLSIMPCSYLSDHFGRKPVVLAGTLGLAISIGLFGMAKTYWLMLLTRLIGGMLGGTNATIRVMLSEAIDGSDQGLAFSLSTVAYRMGQIIGQPMGGLLSHPERNFSLFDRSFWHEYPFALPCFISSAFAVLGVIFGSFAIGETLPSLRKKGKRTEYEATMLSHAADSSINVSSERTRPSIRSVLTAQVVGALITSSFQAFCSEMIFALYPLFAFTPIKSGGLGFREAQIGTQLGFRSIINVTTVLFYSPLERRIGTMRMHKLTMSFWPVSVTFFPLLNLLARLGWAGTLAFRLLLGLFFTVWSFACLSYTSATLVINNSTPSADALSVINGVGQMALTLPMAFAPAFTTSVFAFSIKHKTILHGNLVYVIQSVISLLGVIYTLLLKETAHDWHEDGKNRGEEADS